MPLARLTETIRERANRSAPLGHKVRFDLGTDGVIFVDGTERPAQVTNDGSEPADATLRATAEALGAILAGTLDPTLAYMTGKLKVDGSLGVAMKLNAMLEG
ncbi:MAG: SCP2 sterol-binding domain-containing protein [Inquilinaceae bacterium]